MKNQTIKFIILTNIILIIASCNPNTDDIITPADKNLDLYKEVLKNIGTNVISETLKDFSQKTNDLKLASDNLVIGDNVSLNVLKNAWLEAREPWEKSESFAFGPVLTDGSIGVIDVAVDSWPVNVTSINAILVSAAPINTNLLNNNNEARGFHTIEFLAWGASGNKIANDLTNREILYLKATCADLAFRALNLYNNWLATKDNFVANIINAGQQNEQIYTTQKSAFIELVDGTVGVATEVATSKIENALNGGLNGGANQNLDESQYSQSTKFDLLNNIRGIQNIYLGDYNNLNGKGLTDLVRTRKTDLDNLVKMKINESIAAINAISGTFATAIFNERIAVANAQTKVAELQQLLDSDVRDLLSNL